MSSPWWKRYPAAAGFIFLAWILQLWLAGIVGSTELPFLFFFPAIALTAWYSGTAAAFVALFLAITLADHFFLDSAHRMTAILTFAVATLPIITAVEMLRRAGARMAAEMRQRQQAEDLLSATVASIGDGVLVTDPHGRVMFLNPKAEALTGWSRTEATGRSLREVFPILKEQTRDFEDKVVARVLGSSVAANMGNHTILIARDGREIPIDDSAAPIRSHGGVSGVVLVFRDVTEKRLAEEFRARLAAIVEYSGEAIITKDLNGFVMTWNAAAERILGYKAEEIVGRSIMMIVPPEKANEEMEIMTNLRNGTPFQRIETYRVARNGQQIPISLSVSPIKDNEGAVIGASKILHDVREIVAVRDSLARESERLKTTLRSIGDAVVMTDERGHVTFLNAEAERMTAWTEPEAAGRPLSDVFRIINEETRRPVDNPVDKVLRTGTTIGLANHTVLLAKDGSECPIDDSAAPINAADGTLFGVVLVFRDFTARRQAERTLRESEERFRLMANAAPVLIWISGPDKRCTWFNQRWLDFVGRSMEDEVGNGWADNVHPDDLATCIATYEQAFDSRLPFEMTYRLRRADGMYRWMLDSGVPRFESAGRFTGYIGSCVDITDRKQIEEDLLQEARRKDEFLAILSHELRNPLAAIQMAITLLQRTKGHQQDPQHFDEIIARQTAHMTRLLDDLIDVSRVSSGNIALRKERIDLRKTVAIAAESVEGQMNSQRHEFTEELPENPVYVDADPVRVAQVVTNLLSNAARYTEKGGHIRLTISQDANDAIIRVYDTGIGLSADQIPRLFGMFTQIDRPLERRAGLGVGLALSKQLVELHGGNIEAKSEGLGKGSEFIVRLPLASGAVPIPLPTESRDKPPFSPKRILVADDNIDSARTLAVLLRLDGHDVRTVHDGLAAVEMARTFAPEVAILDIGMPKLNGYDVARRIKAFGFPTMLIALTGWGQERDRQRGHDAGFDHHLTKPAEISMLEEILASSEPH